MRSVLEKVFSNMSVLFRPKVKAGRSSKDNEGNKSTHDRRSWMEPDARDF